MRRGGCATVLVFSAAATTACGSRTTLPVEVGSVEDAAVPDATTGDGRAGDSSEGDTSAADVDAETSSHGDGGGCLSNADCDDGIDCTRDRCERAARTCVHVPDDDLCSPGYVCTPPTGCVATAFAVSDVELYGVALPAARVRRIGPVTPMLADVALSPDGALYGVTEKSLYAIDPKTGVTTKIGVAMGSLNALDFGPDGTLYGAGDTEVFTVDPKTGVVTPLAELPDGYQSSGDIAISGDLLLASGAGGSVDVLVTLDLSTGAGHVVGPIEYGCVWGLAAKDSVLYGFTCNGQILEIDQRTGKGTVLSTPGPAFTGASSR